MSRLCPICSSDHHRQDCSGLALIHETVTVDTVSGKSARKRVVARRWAPGDKVKHRDDKDLTKEEQAIAAGIKYHAFIHSPRSTNREPFYWVALGRILSGGDLHDSIGKTVLE